MARYVIIQLPFKNELQQVLTAIDELLIVFCVSSLFFLYAYEGNPKVAVNLSLIVIAIIFFSTFKTTSVVLYIIIWKCVEVVMEHIFKIKFVKRKRITNEFERIIHLKSKKLF